MGQQRIFTVNGSVTQKILFGESVLNNPVPERTTMTSEPPIATFRDPETGRCFGIDREMLSHHLLYVGSPGMGKTNGIALLLSGILRFQEAADIVCIFDTKGDYYETYRDRCLDRDVIVVGNSAKYEQVTSFWNIFYDVAERDANGNPCYNKRCDLTAVEIVTALFSGHESETQPFFHNAAIDIVSAVIIHLLREAVRTGNTDKLNNCYLARFLKEASREEYLAILRDEHNPDFHGMIEYIYSGEKMTAQSQSVMSVIRAMAKKTLTGVFGDMYPPSVTRKREFSMQGLVRKKRKTVIFIEYDLSLTTLGSLYKLLIDLALKRVLGGREEQRGHFYLMLDELALIKPKLEHLGNALSFGRGLNVKVIAGIQNVSQLYDIYGKDEGNVILADFMNVICFYLSDAVSRSYLSDRFGPNYYNISFQGQTDSADTQREGHCVEEWTMTKLERGQAVVKLAGESPFLFHFPKFAG